MSLMLVAGLTVNGTPLLAIPPTVTTTLPVVAPVGTGATMLVSLQFAGVGAAGTPVNVIVVLPFVAPKPAPGIMAEAPTAPRGGRPPPTAVPAVAACRTPCRLLSPPQHP